MEQQLFSSVLDEATSALDTSTESKLYSICKDFGITVSSVGHRRSLRQVCIFAQTRARRDEITSVRIDWRKNARTHERAYERKNEYTKARRTKWKKWNDLTQMHGLVTSLFNIFSLVSRLWIEPWRRRRMGIQENWRLVKFCTEVEKQIECWK